jgi:hypothetical protein
MFFGVSPYIEEVVMKHYKVLTGMPVLAPVFGLVRQYVYTGKGAYMKKQWIIGCVVLAIALSLGMGACKVDDIGLANTKWEKTIGSYDYTLEFGNDDYEISFTYSSITVGTKGDCEASFGNIKFSPKGGDSISGKYTYFFDTLTFSDFDKNKTNINGDWKKK